MNRPSITHLVIALCMFVITACGPASGSLAQGANQPVFNRDADASYAGEFRMQFTGAKNWDYQLTTRKIPTMREVSLHMDGLQSAQNPGDVRLVTDNTTTWMTGAGTDQQCVQFPNGKGMDPTFIYPESLVNLPTLGSALKLVGEEQLAGFSVLHFHADGATSGPWHAATIDLWQEKGSGMLRQFVMTASGEDPFFGAGPGKLVAGYAASALGGASIAAVTGCEISVPLPQAISMFVRLPGMASFDSQSTLDELVKFYQDALPGQKWTVKDPPAQAQGGTVLSYQRGADSVEIQIKQNPSGGSAVKLIFITGN